MASMILYTFVLFAIFSQGHSVTEIQREDVNVTYISNPIFGTSLIISKAFWDSLLSCHVTFPDGTEYEAYPNASIPYQNVFFMYAVQPFTSCAIGFRGVGEEFSGTYQLASKVFHSGNHSQSLTRQRFNVKVIVVER